MVQGSNPCGPTLIIKHYRELTTEDQATAWFSILPKPDQWQNTITDHRQTRSVKIPAGQGTAAIGHE